MKTVNDDPYDFFNEGGWGFLQTNDDVRSDLVGLFPAFAANSPSPAQEPGSSDESEEGSEFAASDVEEEDEESDFSDESAYSDASESGSGTADDLSDSGEEWSDAERRLERKEKTRGGESDDDRSKKVSSKTKAKSGGRR